MNAPSAANLRREFLLDPEVTFLNHGSFGACPRPVFERYQAWQQELESEPVDFFVRRFPDLLDRARAALADYVGCPAEELAVAAYTTREDIDRLLAALTRELDAEHGQENE